MKKAYIITFLLVIATIGCVRDFPLDDDWSNTSYKLLNQDSTVVFFPQLIKDKISVVGFIYTNCPDICPLTTNNMRLIKEKLNNENIADIQFVTISFDPEFDTPSVLKKYAETRNLDLNNWTFLTGEKKEIKRLLKTAGVVAAPNDSTVFEDKSKIYYYLHTDRISLFDSKTHLRKNYYGSSIDIEEIIEDIKRMKEE